jgi:hypothetical protein
MKAIDEIKNGKGTSHLVSSLQVDENDNCVMDQVQYTMHHTPYSLRHGSVWPPQGPDAD